jgi:spermidine synthase
VGQALKRHHPGQPKHVGIVGLGVGTLAAYGHEGDTYRLYEINPDVIAIAHKHFTFLSDCRAGQTVVTGDARLALEFEEPQEFDVLVLDAFSGDAVPVHLLTREAMAVYLKHVKPDGLLALHISNLHFDLRPVIAGLAVENGLTCVIHQSWADPMTAAKDAVWALVARSPEVLASSVGLDSNSHSARPPVLWTDDCSNLFEVLTRAPAP